GRLLCGNVRRSNDATNAKQRQGATDWEAPTPALSGPAELTKSETYVGLPRYVECGRWANRDPNLRAQTLDSQGGGCLVPIASDVEWGDCPVNTQTSSMRVGNCCRRQIDA